VACVIFSTGTIVYFVMFSNYQSVYVCVHLSVCIHPRVLVFVHVYGCKGWHGRDYYYSLFIVSNERLEFIL
jgi:hypothetical protein